MDAIFPAASSLAASAVGSLFSAIWEGAALAVCVVFCLRLFPRLSAAARSFVWMNVFLLLLLLHVALFLGAQGSTPSLGHSPLLQLGLVWSFLIAGIWILLSLWRATQLIASAIRLRGLVNRATPVPADAALQALLQIRTDAGRLRRSAALCSSTEVERPSVFGFFQPRILFPPALLKRLTAVELQQVVIHEMEHLRRADDWTNLLQKIALVLFPMNPALLWVERRLCTERELACDDSVLRSSCGRKAYAICLTHLAEYSMLRRSLSLVLGAWERQSELVRRVHRILRRPSASMSRKQTWALTGSLVAGVLVCAFGLARSPQLVSFAPAAQLEQAHLAAPTIGLRAVNAEYFGRAQSALTAAHAQMVKAIMPSPQIDTTATAKPVQKSAALRNVRRRPAQSRQAWVVMTAWTENEAGARMVLTVAQTSRIQGGQTQQAPRTQDIQGLENQNMQRQIRTNRVSYAAVPFGNGWLLIQI
jgi:beta-lactamase regulating signal transducer with metallopeptidase domain